MPKTVKILFYVLVGVIFSLIASQSQAANITFSADVELGFSSVPSTLYINTGSECDTLTVSASPLTADIPASSYIDLETAANSVLKVTPVSGTVTLYFDTTYFSTGYITQWTASSTLATNTATIVVKVLQTNEQYRIRVNGTHFNDYYSDASGLVSFTYGGFSGGDKVFTISKVELPVGGGSGGGGSIITDTTAPSISNIKETVSDVQNTITWDTNETSLSWIVYGTSTNFGLEEKTTNYVASHSITLKNLLPETTYFYRIKSKDSTGNEGSYTDKVFTTLSSSQAAETTVSKPISQMTTEELQAEIIRITALIVQLQSQLTGTVSGGVKITGIPSDFTFKTTLKSGIVLPEVKYLQLILNSDAQTKLASSGVGSPGNETNIFGALTKAAVIKFQNKYVSEILTPLGLTKGTGIVGKATINKLNSLLGK